MAVGDAGAMEQSDLRPGVGLHVHGPEVGRRGGAGGPGPGDEEDRAVGGRPEAVDSGHAGAGTLGQREQQGLVLEPALERGVAVADLRRLVPEGTHGPAEQVGVVVLGRSERDVVASTVLVDDDVVQGGPDPTRGPLDALRTQPDRSRSPSRRSVGRGSRLGEPKTAAPAIRRRCRRRARGSGRTWAPATASSRSRARMATPHHSARRHRLDTHGAATVTTAVVAASTAELGTTPRPAGRVGRGIWSSASTSRRSITRASATTMSTLARPPARSSRSATRHRRRSTRTTIATAGTSAVTSWARLSTSDSSESGRRLKASTRSSSTPFTVSWATTETRMPIRTRPTPTIRRTVSAGEKARRSCGGSNSSHLGVGRLVRPTVHGKRRAVAGREHHRRATYLSTRSPTRPGAGTTGRTITDLPRVRRSHEHQ